MDLGKIFQLRAGLTRMSSVTKVLGPVIFLIALAVPHAANAADPPSQSCQTFAPVLSVPGENWYSDKAGSIVDHAALMRHQEDIKPLRSYVSNLVQLLDSGQDASKFGCARQNLREWAAANALLEKPANFAGTRERLRFTTTIDFVLLRMKADNQPVEESVRHWLREVNESIADDYGKRGLYDNQRIWSGVAAETAALAVDSPKLTAYSNDVWQHAIAGISENGAITTEVRRQSRALLYHAYYLSALLYLREAREATGIKTTSKEAEAIRHLYMLVRAGTCEPKAFATATGLNIAQNPAPEDQDISSIAALAPDMAASAPSCQQSPATTYYPLLGGDLQVIKQAIKKAAH